MFVPRGQTELQITRGLEAPQKDPEPLVSFQGSGFS